MNQYIHIPFCRSKCKYCHFASFSGIEDVLVERYLGFLKKEIREFFSSPGSSPGLKSDTIYFGGGTPSLLRLDELKSVLDEFKLAPSVILNAQKEALLGYSFKDSLSINSVDPETSSGGQSDKIIEITLEANPEFITREYVKGLLGLGINRISMGIQTLREKSLEEIGRCKESAIYNALDILEEMNFPNVAVDFIIGLPHVKKGETKADIEILLCRYSVIKHISAYMLEEGKYPESWKENSISDDELGLEYEEVAGFLREKGFARYELSNFAKAGYECKHNSGYWNHTEYAGFGLSASSFMGNRRFTNASSFIGYYTGKIDNEEELNSDDLELEKMMFDFRTSGVETRLLKNPSKLKELSEDRLVEIIDEKIRPTDKGVAIVDYMFKELFL